MSTGEDPQVNVALGLDPHNVAFLRTAYETILGRAPDAEGLNYYGSLLERGFSKAEVLDQLCRSREAKGKGVRPLRFGWIATKASVVRRAWPKFGGDRERHHAPSPPPSSTAPGSYVDKMEAQALADQMREQVSAVMGISEGLASAVQGLQQASQRHEQNLASLQASLDATNEVRSEVTSGLGIAIRSQEGVLKRHEKTLAALRQEIDNSFQFDLEKIRSNISESTETLKSYIDSTLKDIYVEIESKPKTEDDQKKISPFTELKIDHIDQKSHWLAVDNDNIRKRIEFIRKEIMLEIQSLNSRTSNNGGAFNYFSDYNLGQACKKINRLVQFPPDQVKRANLGCGHLPLEGFVNVDGRDLPGVDVVADLRQLPFEAASVDELRATHVVEHFPEQILRTEILPHWASVLRPGGKLLITAPHARAMIEGLTSGMIDWETTKLVLMGAQEYQGDYHFSLLDPATVCSLLKGAGFRSAEITAEARKNGDCIEFEIVATR